MKRIAALVIALAAGVNPAVAFAWGTTGHRIIGKAAMDSLPPDLPPFLTTPENIDVVSALGPEMDELKGAGVSYDRDIDPGHYVNVGDDGRIAGAVALAALPADMEAYERALETARTDPYKEGYLPYAIADGWQVLRKDFALWRAFDYLDRNAAAEKDRAAFARLRALRERMTIDDLGVWAHFVGDGSQPLHTSVHYNEGGIHAPFEGAFVRDRVTVQSVEKLLSQGGPRARDALISQRQLMDAIGAYLSTTNAQAPQLYAIARRGGFKHATHEAVAFANARVADGARELRDLIVMAWDNSLYESVGYPGIPVEDILSGKVHPNVLDFGRD